MAVFPDATGARGLRVETYALEFILHIALFYHMYLEP